MSKINPQEENIGGTARAKILFNGYRSMSNQFLKVITTWCFSLLAMNTVYLAFNFFDFKDNMSGGEKASCIAISVVLHFFLICSFCFALTISIIQYFIFFKSFTVVKFIYIKAVAFSLGISLGTFRIDFLIF